MSKLKIHAIIKYFYPVTAGIEVNMMETYSYIAKAGNKVTIHTSKDEYLAKNSLPDKAKIRGLDVRRYPFHGWGFWPQINWQQVNLICLHNFDIFPHFQIMVYSLWLKLLGKKKFALVLTPHGGFSLDTVWNLFPLWQRVVKRTYHQTLGKWLINQVVDGVRAVSEWEKQEMISSGIRPEKIEVISNGIEDEAYMDIEKLASKGIKTKVRKWGKYLIRIGRIYPIKNDETIIKALLKLPTDIKLVIVGPVERNKYSQYIDSLTSLISKLKLEKRVIFAGVVRGVDKYYLIKKSQMMVHMAMWESFCNVVHEGMSQGKICIVADNTALPLLIKDGVNGYCVPTKAHQTLSKKINYVLKNKNSRQMREMSARNRELGLQESWEEVAGKMDVWYGSLLIDKKL